VVGGVIGPVVSLVPRRFEEGATGGVPRFDWELRKAIPGLVSWRSGAITLARLTWLRRRHPELIVITSSELSVRVPASIRTLVVHHGCAQTHYDRDPDWRTATTRRVCKAQARMYALPNRQFVSPARWTARQFAIHYDVPEATVVPHWAPEIPRTRATPSVPVVMGDWRTFNKGQKAVAALARALPEYEFRPLECTYDTRAAAYQSADVYLCLSLSEGGSYSMCDAEAAALPIVSTEVGNCEEFKPVIVPWQQRDEIPVVRTAIEQALAHRRGPSFYESWTLRQWSRAWAELIERARDVVEAQAPAQ